MTYFCSHYIFGSKWLQWLWQGQPCIHSPLYLCLIVSSLVLFAFVFFEQLASMKEIICAVVFLIVGSLVEGKSKYVSVNLDAKWDSTPMLLEARYCIYAGYAAQ